MDFIDDDGGSDEDGRGKSEGRIGPGISGGVLRAGGEVVGRGGGELGDESGETAIL